jgi:hypothetical protein
MLRGTQHGSTRARQPVLILDQRVRTGDVASPHFMMELLQNRSSELAVAKIFRECGDLSQSDACYIVAHIYVSFAFAVNLSCP